MKYRHQQARRQVAWLKAGEADGSILAEVLTTDTVLTTDDRNGSQLS